MKHADALASQLGRAGFVHLRGPFGRDDYLELVRTLGPVLATEHIALRPGAHAYVAKPGPVPPHTDHPEVGAIAWWCEVQDESDGTSLLLDTRPVVEALPESCRTALRSVRLECPPLAGGPPTLSFPVLRETARGEAIFCSPWLRAVGGDVSGQRQLDLLRERLMQAHAHRRACRLRPGEVLIVDNQRVLHGRDAINEQSRRRLMRTWIGW